MIAREVERLERENRALKVQLVELTKKREEETNGARPKSCRFCKYYMQHYVKMNGSYVETYAGHCTKGVPICRGGKKRPAPDDSCLYFELRL